MIIKLLNLIKDNKNMKSSNPLNLYNNFNLNYSKEYNPFLSPDNNVNSIQSTYNNNNNISMDEFNNERKLKNKDTMKINNINDSRNIFENINTNIIEDGINTLKIELFKKEVKQNDNIVVINLDKNLNNNVNLQSNEKNRIDLNKKKIKKRKGWLVKKRKLKKMIFQI